MKFLVLSKKDIFRLIAVLTLGILLGGAGVNLIMGYRLDDMVYENKELAHKLQEEKERLKLFEKDYYGTPVVHKIVLKLNCNADKHTEQELEKKIKDLLTGLVGLKIDQLDAGILNDILHERIIQIDSESYLINPQTIIIDDKLTFIIDVKKLSKNGVDND
mgnify:FL=1